MGRHDADIDPADRQALASLCTRPQETGAFLRAAARITAVLAPIHKYNIPHSTIEKAFGEPVRQVLTQSEEGVSPCRDALRDAPGASGQPIVDIIPQVERIIEVPKLALKEAKNQSNTAFKQFVSVFRDKTHPFVVFPTV